MESEVKNLHRKCIMFDYLPLNLPQQWMRGSALDTDRRQVLGSTPIEAVGLIVQGFPWYSSNLGVPYVNTGYVRLERPPTDRACILCVDNWLS